MTPREKNLTIIDHIASDYGYDRHDILGPRRFKVLVEIRYECIKFFREQGFSTPEIGRIMRRDHSTIVHALQKMAKMEAAE
jgi:chromosomal replication initiation ATPase DnaA